MYTEKNRAKNVEIRNAMQAANVFQWEIADRLGMSDSTFSRMMRHELPPEKKEEILRAIEEAE